MRNFSKSGGTNQKNLCNKKKKKVFILKKKRYEYENIINWKRCETKKW